MTDVARTSAQPPQLTAPQQIRQMLSHYEPVFTKLLADWGISVASFEAQIANALRATPALWNCRPETVLGAALRCAQLGLAPNDVRNLAWIIPYKKDAQFQLGYGGVLELARRASPGLRFDGRAVYPNDQFDLDFGRSPQLVHRPAVVLGLDRGGDAIAWYVRAVWPDGSEQVHVLDRDGVEYHRGFSKILSGGMWETSYDAAALKSVVLDMRRWLPSSVQLAAAVSSDDRVVEIDEVVAEQPEQPDEPEVEPEP